jgi:hypothetical protein
MSKPRVKKYDPTFARMIGNIVAGLTGHQSSSTKKGRKEIVDRATDLARRIMRGIRKEYY